METAFRYWQLMRLASSGHCQSEVLPQVQTWLQATFGEVVEDTAIADQQLQPALVALYQRQETSAELAQLSLRCYISHQIRYVCLQLVNQFGATYGFTAADVLPLVLQDDGKTGGNYRPFSLDILDSYDPNKAQLKTWIARRVKTHPDLDKALLERGLYRASDWSILNDTRVEQLQRILRQYHLCSDAEVAAASQLLQQYHRVYRVHRIQLRQAGKGGRCQPPTSAQLARIDAQRSAQVVMAQLKTLATQLRAYRIHVRGGNPVAFEGEPIDWQSLADGASSDHSETEAGEGQFLSGYRKALSDCLAGALQQVLQTNVVKLRQRQPPKDTAYIEGLRLFHCEGVSMGKLAGQIGLSSQVQVNRLLQLKRLRAETRHVLLPQLQQRVQAEALKYVSADQLRQIDQTLEQLLAEKVDHIIDEATKEAQIPQGRTAKSTFAHQLCQTIHHFTVR